MKLSYADLSKADAAAIDAAFIAAVKDHPNATNKELAEHVIEKLSPEVKLALIEAGLNKMIEEVWNSDDQVLTDAELVEYLKHKPSPRMLNPK